MVFCDTPPLNKHGTSNKGVRKAVQILPIINGAHSSLGLGPPWEGFQMVVDTIWLWGISFLFSQGETPSDHYKSLLANASQYLLRCKAFKGLAVRHRIRAWGGCRGNTGNTIHQCTNGSWPRNQSWKVKATVEPRMGKNMNWCRSKHQSQRYMKVTLCA